VASGFYDRCSSRCPGRCVAEPRIGSENAVFVANRDLRNSRIAVGSAHGFLVFSLTLVTRPRGVSTAPMTRALIKNSGTTRLDERAARDSRVVRRCTVALAPFSLTRSRKSAVSLMVSRGWRIWRTSYRRCRKIPGGLTTTAIYRTFLVVAVIPPRSCRSGARPRAGERPSDRNGR